MFNKLVKLFGVGGKQKTYGTGAINKVEPNVPETKGEKIKRDLTLAKQKSKTAQVNLDNTIFRINQQKKRLEDMKKTKSQTQTRPGKQNLAKGGRAGLKFGSKKSNVQKIQETFSPNKKLSPKQMKIAKLAGNPNKIDAADFAKLRKS